MILRANEKVSNPSFKELNGQLEDLTIFYEFPQETRKIIYTINLIEDLNVKIRKYSKIHCLSYRRVMSSVCLATREATKK